MPQLLALHLFFSAIQSPPSETAGSPVWQMAFVSFAMVLILVEMIRGWRLGIMRQFMRLAAVIAAYSAAYFGGEMLVPLLRPLVKMPDLVIGAIGGLILATIAYGLIAGLGQLLFKRTAQQGSGIVRWVYGTGGALIGCGLGVFCVWLVLFGIRSIGSLAEAQVQARAHAGQARGSLSSSAPAPAPRNLDVDSVTTLLARLKNSVEMGTIGAIVTTSDAMPVGVYQTLGEAGKVLSNPETAQRFLNSPGARELTENPRLVALRNDPEIAAMIEQGRFLELVRDPRIIEVLNDPSLADQIRKFDLKKALGEAKK